MKPTTKKSTTKPVAVPKSKQGTFIPELGTLAGRALLVDMTVHYWVPKAADKDLSKETEEKYDTNGTFSKQLLDQHIIKPVHSAMKRCETTHRELTLPWEDGGARILNSAIYLRYEKETRDAVQKYIAEVDGLVSRWCQLIEAKKCTDKSFKPEHYPSANEIRSRYGVDIRYRPLPIGNDLRCDLAGDALAAVKAAIDSDQQDRIKAAVFNIAERIQEVLKHMVDTLNDYKPAVVEKGKTKKKAESTFRDSLVTNVADLGKLLPSLNVTGDPRIDAIATEMLKLSAVSPDSLRDDDKARAATVNAADAILSKVSDFI